MTLWSKRRKAEREQLGALTATLLPDPTLRPVNSLLKSTFFPQKSTFSGQQNLNSLRETRRLMLAAGAVPKEDDIIKKIADSFLTPLRTDAQNKFYIWNGEKRFTAGKKYDSTSGKLLAAETPENIEKNNAFLLFYQAKRATFQEIYKKREEFLLDVDLAVWLCRNINRDLLDAMGKTKAIDVKLDNFDDFSKLLRSWIKIPRDTRGAKKDRNFSSTSRENCQRLMTDDKRKEYLKSLNQEIKTLFGVKADFPDDIEQLTQNLLNTDTGDDLLFHSNLKKVLDLSSLPPLVEVVEKLQETVKVALEKQGKVSLEKAPALGQSGRLLVYEPVGRTPDVFSIKNRKEVLVEVIYYGSGPQDFEVYPVDPATPSKNLFPPKSKKI